MNSYRQLKIAVARQINSLKNPSFETVETMCREKLAKPEMYTRAAVTDKKKLTNESVVERELDSVMVEVSEIIATYQYLQRCKRWATTNVNAKFSSFCAIMLWDRSQERLKAMCDELEIPSEWVDTLTPALHDDSAAFGFGDMDLNDDVSGDPGGMVDRKPTLEQLDGEPF